MTDHNERSCRYCGSLLHHEDVCSAHATSEARATADAYPGITREDAIAACAELRQQVQDVRDLADRERDRVRTAFLEMAEECERRAAGIDEGQGRVMPVEAAQPLESLAAWARGRAGT